MDSSVLTSVSQRTTDAKANGKRETDEGVEREGEVKEKRVGDHVVSKERPDSETRRTRDNGEAEKMNHEFFF